MSLWYLLNIVDLLYYFKDRIVGLIVKALVSRGGEIVGSSPIGSIQRLIFIYVTSLIKTHNKGKEQSNIGSESE